MASSAATKNIPLSPATKPSVKLGVTDPSNIQTIVNLLDSWTALHDVTEVHSMTLVEPPIPVAVWRLSDIKRRFSVPNTTPDPSSNGSSTGLPVLCPRIPFDTVPDFISTINAHMISKHPNPNAALAGYRAADPHFESRHILAQRGMLEPAQDSGDWKTWRLIKEGIVAVTFASNMTQRQRETLANTGSAPKPKEADWEMLGLYAGTMIVFPPHTVFTVVYGEDSLMSAGTIISAPLLG